MGNTKNVTYIELAAFFLPIAASMIIIMSSHSIISSALARTTDAAIALAAYSVAKSISNMFQSPCNTLRQMTITLFRDQETYGKIVRLAIITCVLSLGIMSVVVFTPLSRVIFVRLIGVSEELLMPTLRAFTILLIMPILAAVRSINQGAITASKKTYLLTISTIIRVVVMLLLATVIINTQFITGSIVGSFMMVAGLGSEAIFTFIVARKLKYALPEKPELSAYTKTSGQMWLFFLPLVVAQFAMAWGQPSVNAGLARVINPEISLAAYQVGRSFAWIFIGMFGRIHQIALVYARNCASWLKVRRFSLFLGASLSAILLMFTITPIGEWILLNIIGVDQVLTDMAMATILSMSLIPLILSINETYSGLLISRDRTPVITFSKFVNVGVLITSVLVLSRLFPEMGATIGGWSSVIGYLAEFVILFALSRKVVGVITNE